MVKFYESAFSYDYSFPAVTLAYFLRYPNPYSTHVLSTDVIDRYFDPTTQRLYTTRLHLKRGKIPAAVVKLLPRSFLGSTRNGSSESYILEKSVVDVREGWMKAENRNLEWTGILSVVETQHFQRPRVKTLDDGGRQSGGETAGPGNITDVTTTVTFQSRFGQKVLLGSKKRKTSRTEETGAINIEDEPKPGFFASLSTNGIQRSIELIGLRKSADQLKNSKEGMKVVLERMRRGGLVGVLEGMRKDREAASGSEGPWKRVFHNGNDNTSPRVETPSMDIHDPFEED